MKYGFCSPGVCLLVPVFGWESFGQREGRRDISWQPSLAPTAAEPEVRAGKGPITTPLLDSS